MKVKQLSVFLENKKGRLAAVIQHLGDEGVNISAFSLADTTDFGIARMIVDDTEKAKEVLTNSGVVVKLVDVMVVKVEDKPGALVGILNSLSDEGVSVEYMYAFYEKGTDGAMMVLKVDDTQKAEKILA